MIAKCCGIPLAMLVLQFGWNSVLGTDGCLGNYFASLNVADPVTRA